MIVLDVGETSKKKSYLRILCEKEGDYANQNSPILWLEAQLS